MLIGGRRPGCLTPALAQWPRSVPVAPGDVAEVDHAGGHHHRAAHDAGRPRSPGFAFWSSGKAVRLGRASISCDAGGNVLAEDCSRPGTSGPAR